LEPTAISFKKLINLSKSSTE